MMAIPTNDREARALEQRYLRRLRRQLCAERARTTDRLRRGELTAQIARCALQRARLDRETTAAAAAAA